MAERAPFIVGEWLVEPALDRIRRKSETRNLRPRVMELLVYLADRPGTVVSTDELLGRLWDGRVVSEGSVYNCVSELRTALASDDRDEAAIATVPKKGYRLVAPVSQPSPAADGNAASRRRRNTLLAIASALVLAASAFWLQERGTAERKIRSLVVLPLDNHSADPLRDEYFVDGMTEALIARLGRIEELRIISRTSAMKLKNSDMTIPEIARALDVDGVVEGSVMTTDSQIRLTLQLIDGRSDRHLWVSSFTRDLDDILDLQDEIADSIAGELRARLVAPRDLPSAAVAVTRRPVTDDPDAYRAYLKARYYFNRFGEENFRAALAHYEDAVAIDPDFALAYAARAEVCMQPAVIYNGIRSLDDCARDARRALRLDDSMAEAYAALGFVQLFRWEWRQSETNLVRAVELDPNSVMARTTYMLLLRTTYRFDEALLQIRRAATLDPLNLFVRTMVGWPLYDQGRYRDALTHWDDVIDMDPGFMLAHYNRGLAYIQMRDADAVFTAARSVAAIAGEQALEVRLLHASGHAIRGETEAAMEIIAGIERDSGAFMAAWIASIYLLMGEENLALARLERGVDERAVDMPTIAEPKFDSVRQHPRFLAVSRRMGITDVGRAPD